MVIRRMRYVEFMRMKLHIAILSVITITLAGCANTETVELHTQPSVETIEETQSIIEEEETMTESEILSTEDTIEVSSAEEEVVVVNGFELVKEATVDLDGDGTEEKISFVGKEIAINGEIVDPTWCALEGEKERFAIVDYDITDDFLEILVPCDWTDMYLVFLRYNCGEIIYMGEIHDYIQDEHLMIKGDGIIHGRTRMDVHQTSYVQDTFIINEENWIERTEQETDYIYTGGRKYPLLENLPVYAEKDRNAEKTIIEPQDVQFRRTDGKHWVEVVAEDGMVGWMYVGEIYTITDCDNKDVTEVFEGTGYCN